THDDVTTARPAHHVRHVVSAINVEHENRYEITGSDADGDALRYQQRHRDHHGKHAWHHQIINGINCKRAECIDLLGHFHRADLSRHRSADSPGDHQCGQNWRKLAA